MKLVLIGDNSIRIRKVKNDEVYELIENNESIELHDILAYTNFEVEIKNIKNPFDLQFDGTEDYLKLYWDINNSIYKIMEV